MLLESVLDLAGKGTERIMHARLDFYLKTVVALLLLSSRDRNILERICQI